MNAEFTLKDFPPEKRAALIAEQVLRNYDLVGRKGTHRITAVEFYVNSPDFCDSSNHCHPLQLQNGIWYVHTAKNHESLKAPRYSGIDLACGNEKQGIHAGMLIRQLDGDGGSGKAIMKLIRGADVGEGILPKGDSRLRWSEEEKKFLYGMQGKDAFSEGIHLKLRKQPWPGMITARKRIGIEGTSHSELLLHFKISLEQ